MKRLHSSFVLSERNGMNNSIELWMLRGDRLLESGNLVWFFHVANVDLVARQEFFNTLLAYWTANGEQHLTACVAQHLGDVIRHALSISDAKDQYLFPGQFQEIHQRSLWLSLCHRAGEVEPRGKFTLYRDFPSHKKR